MSHIIIMLACLHANRDSISYLTRHKIIIKKIYSKATQPSPYSSLFLAFLSHSPF